MPPAVERQWTDEQIVLLRDQWETSNSCAQIAAEINRTTGSAFSRNAIIGKVSRLGLSRRIAKRAASAPRVRKARDRRVRPERVRAPEPVESLLPPPEFLGVAWEVAVEDDGCMYPEGHDRHMLFCGQPRLDNSSYCAGHHHVCWVKARVPIRSFWRAA